jgi:hypothetical protein
MEEHPSRIKQAEDRLSELEDEMEITGKTVTNNRKNSNNSKPVKGICKNSLTQSKDQT